MRSRKPSTGIAGVADQCCIHRNLVRLQIPDQLFLLRLRPILLAVGDHIEHAAAPFGSDRRQRLRGRQDRIEQRDGTPSPESDRCCSCPWVGEVFGSRSDCSCGRLSQRSAPSRITARVPCPLTAPAPRPAARSAPPCTSVCSTTPLLYVKTATSSYGANAPCSASAKR